MEHDVHIRVNGQPLCTHPAGWEEGLMVRCGHKERASAEKQVAEINAAGFTGAEVVEGPCPAFGDPDWEAAV